MLQNGLSHRGQSVCADTPQAVSNKFSLSCPKRPPALAKVTGFPLAVHFILKIRADAADSIRNEAVLRPIQ